MLISVFPHVLFQTFHRTIRNGPLEKMIVVGGGVFVCVCVCGGGGGGGLGGGGGGGWESCTGNGQKLCNL